MHIVPDVDFEGRKLMDTMDEPEKMNGKAIEVSLTKKVRTSLAFFQNVLFQKSVIFWHGLQSIPS